VAWPGAAELPADGRLATIGRPVDMTGSANLGRSHQRHSQRPESGDIARVTGPFRA
jgi:hypothetical protein